jgi:hypothetical protein
MFSKIKNTETQPWWQDRSQIHSYNAPEELGMYGIYHSSLKSLAKLQEFTEKGSALIKEIGGEDYPPHPRYCQNRTG